MQVIGACGRDIKEVVEGSAGYAANNSTLPVDQEADDFDARCEKRLNEELGVQESFLHDIFGPLLFRLGPRRSYFVDLERRHHSPHGPDNLRPADL